VNPKSVQVGFGSSPAVRFESTYRNHPQEMTGAADTRQLCGASTNRLASCRGFGFGFQNGLIPAGSGSALT
jgi:hypothetical protein